MYEYAKLILHIEPPADMLETDVLSAVAAQPGKQLNSESAANKKMCDREGGSCINNQICIFLLVFLLGVF